MLVVVLAGWGAMVVGREEGEMVAVGRLVAGWVVVVMAALVMVEVVMVGGMWVGGLVGVDLAVLGLVGEGLEVGVMVGC